MTEKKLSRRDAIKLIGTAASATALANLPSKWSTPELASGVLPAHAQTSLLYSFLSCDLTLDISTGAWSSAPFITPVPMPTFIGMKFTLTLVNTHFIGGTPSPYTNNWSIDQSTGSTIYVNSNNIVLPGPMAPDAGQTSGSVTVLWEFYPGDGVGTCSKTVNWSIPLVYFKTDSTPQS